MGSMTMNRMTTMDNGNTEKTYLQWILRSIFPADTLLEVSASSNMSLPEKVAALHDIDYEVLVPFDDNRVGDAINLRYRYGVITATSDYIIGNTLDRWPPSILEVIAALSLKAGEQLVGYPYVSIGARWIFMEIVNNLGLPSAVDKTDIRIIADSFNERLYSKDGYGGPFYIPDCETDMRDMELWKQLTVYLQVNEKRFNEYVKSYH